MDSPKLSFGYLYDFRNPEQWRRPWNSLYQETLDVVAWSETAGFGGAWVPEHHGADDGYMPVPNLALAAMAARTTIIRIGAAVAIAPLYHPVRFAEECAILDILSNGRLETALAIGYRRREYEMQSEPTSDFFYTVGKTRPSILREWIMHVSADLGPARPGHEDRAFHGPFVRTQRKRTVPRRRPCVSTSTAPMRRNTWLCSTA